MIDELFFFRNKNRATLKNMKLTVFLVEQNLELVVKLVFQDVVNPTDRLLVSQFAIHECAPAGLLHDFRPVVAGNLAEGLVAVNYGEVDDLCVGQKETAVCCKRRNETPITSRKSSDLTGDFFKLFLKKSP